MAERTRYFKNNLPDYSGSPPHIKPEVWKPYILAMAHECAEKQPVNSRNIDGGLYLGTAGIAYMFFHLSQSPIFAEEKTSLLDAAALIIEKTEQLDSKQTKETADISSFILGEAGLNAVSAAINHALGDEKAAQERLEKYNKAASILKSVNCFSFGGDELFFGRAGYISGGLWLNKVFDKDVIPEPVLKELCCSIFKSGKKRARNSTIPLNYSYYGTEYFGAAHGISSILQMILSCPTYLSSLSSPERQDVYGSVDFLLATQFPNGNFPSASDEIKDRNEGRLVHWCHGAPGVVYLMAKAYLLTGNPKYMSSCVKCGDITWEKGLLKKGPGICHGIAGNGYVHLLLYRLSNEQKYLHRANEFAKFMQTPQFADSRTPDHPYSLYEGTAGTVCFLADLLTPEKAAFPFLDVF